MQSLCNVYYSYIPLELAWNYKVDKAVQHRSVFCSLLILYDYNYNDYQDMSISTRVINIRSHLITCYQFLITMKRTGPRNLEGQQNIKPTDY